LPNQEELELQHLPRHYRWLLKLFLKLPTPGFPYFVLKRLPEIEGVFWAVGIPVFLVAYFLFSVWLVAFLSLHVVFPLNLMLGLLIPAVIFVFFLRIQLKRTILWWRSLQNPSRRWDVSKAVEEYAELIRKQKRQRAKRP